MKALPLKENILRIISLFLFLNNGLAFCEEAQSSTPIGEDDYIWETISLIYNGGFEPIEDADSSVFLSKIWECSSDNTENRISLDKETYLSGKSALRVDGAGIVNVSTKDIPIPSGMVSITGSIFYRGDFPSKVFVKWLKGDETIDQKELRLIENKEAEWKRYMLSETSVPPGAVAIRFLLTTNFSSNGTVWWDEGNFTGVIEQQKRVDIFVNQVGYDLLYPKACILATNFKPEKIESYLLGESDREIKKLYPGEPGRIVGAHKSDWGKWFYRVNFSDYNEEGTYRIVVIIEGKKYYSAPFFIGKDLLWEKTIPIVLEGIRLHRCGTKIEGIHEPCHTDDAFEGNSLTGGWHDGETYSKTKSSLCLNLLAESCNICTWRLLKNNDLNTKMKEEIEWGAQYIVNRVKDDGKLVGNIVSRTGTDTKKPEEETDNQPATGDERPIQEFIDDEDTLISALGNLTYLLSKTNPENPYSGKTEILTQSMLSQGKKPPGLFSALVYLEEIKGTGNYISSAKLVVPENLLCVSEVIPRYDAFTYENKTYDLVQVLKNTLQSYAEQANQNPFRICPIKWTPEVDFFGVTINKGAGLKGNNIHLLQIAQLAGKAFRFIPEDMTKNLFFDHINWILGVNPYGICFIEGLGTKNLSGYAHPFVKHGVNPEKLVGVIPFGIRATSQNSDVPYLDISPSPNSDIGSTGISIETMALYINALAHFYRVRVHPETVIKPSQF